MACQNWFIQKVLSQLLPQKSQFYQVGQFVFWDNLDFVPGLGNLEKVGQHHVRVGGVWTVVGDSIPNLTYYSTELLPTLYHQFDA